jgi:large subunit ribosomal protein L16
MLQPKRTKWRRPHIIKYEGNATKGTKVQYGDFGLVATEGKWVSAAQIESVRVVLSKFTDKGGQVWIRIFPQLAKTKKPAEVRMGSGKGNPEYWVAVVKKGTVMFEIAGIPQDKELEALRLASYKLPCSTKVLAKEIKAEVK